MADAERIKTTPEQRRVDLVERCHQERSLLVKHASEIRNGIAFIEERLQTVTTIGKLPLLGLGAFAAFFLLKPKRALWVMKAGISCWRFSKKYWI